jgi:outer membrane protein OmpA-like peptidoglycan-associated protein
MSRVRNPRAPARACARRVASALLATTLAGCAGKSYVVLLPDHDGKVGKVHVTTAEGTVSLDEAGEGTAMGGLLPARSFAVSDAKLGEDFASALAASPLPPTSFMLYFQFGATELVDVSRSHLPTILEEIARRPAPEVSVIGHTDTVGDARRNEQLARERATAVVGIIRAEAGESSAVRIVTESHGERNLLVPTPDETYEPRNRRVEVTVR